MSYFVRLCQSLTFFHTCRQLKSSISGQNWCFVTKLFWTTVKKNWGGGGGFPHPLGIFNQKNFGETLIYHVELFGTPTSFPTFLCLSTNQQLKNPSSTNHQSILYTLVDNIQDNICLGSETEVKKKSVF